MSTAQVISGRPNTVLNQCTFKSLQMKLYSSHIYKPSPNMINTAREIKLIS